MEEVRRNELVAAIGAQLERVRELCEANDVATETKVHEIRKSFKRVNALLKFFPENLCAEIDSFRKPMREMARRLTFGRESTVNLQLFNQLVAEIGGLDNIKNDALREALLQTQISCLHELIETENIFDNIRKLIGRGTEKLLPFLQSTRYAVAVFETIKTTFLRSENLYRAIAGCYDAELFHSLRKLMKILWYQSELEAPGQTELPGTILEQLHAITDRQGDDHDWYIFMNEISQQKYTLEAPDLEALKKQVRQIQRANMEVLQQSLSLFFQQTEHDYLEHLRRL